MTNTAMNAFLIYMKSPLIPFLVHDTVAVKRILVYIVDTDPAALKCRAVWEDTLCVPLGPDAAMAQHGKQL